MLRRLSFITRSITLTGAVLVLFAPILVSAQTSGGALTRISNAASSTAAAISDAASSTAATLSEIASDTSSRPFTPIAPNPAVPIPGVRFTPATEENGQIFIPYLAQYISGIYRLSVGLGAILAAIMIVYGGFRYLLSASLSDVKDGKTIITDAVIGLIVLLTSYLILKTINPALVTESVIRVGQISEIQASEEMMNTTHGQTSGDEFTPASAPAGRTAVPASTSCPFTDLPEGHIDCGDANQTPCTPAHCAALGRPANCHDDAVREEIDPRASAFAARMSNQTHNPDPRQRVIEVGNAAAACAIHLESCGHTVGAIRRIAGMSTPERHKFESSALVHSVREVRCERPRSCGGPPAGCTSDATEAKNRVRALVRDQQDARANMLEPGDWVWIYNANTQDCAGQHSVMFVSWDGDGPYANVVQGQWGKNVRGGRVCLKTSCPGGNFSPITRIQ